MTVSACYDPSMPRAYRKHPLAFQLTPSTWFRAQQVFAVTTRVDRHSMPLRAIWSGQFAFSHRTFSDPSHHELTTQQGKNEAGLRLDVAYCGNHGQSMVLSSVPTNAFALSHAHIGTFLLSSFSSIEAMVTFFCLHPVYVFHARHIQKRDDSPMNAWHIRLNDALGNRARVTYRGNALRILCQQLPQSLTVTSSPHEYPHASHYRVVIDSLDSIPDKLLRGDLPVT
ncbi:hypothetical protein JV59_25805 (plasmid) [Vibrio coralliilyticus]|nr:hypothetical protein JV59_25805 [Vibrio coralliilyticus]